MAINNRKKSSYQYINKINKWMLSDFSSRTFHKKYVQDILLYVILNVQFQIVKISFSFISLYKATYIRNRLNENAIVYILQSI